VCLAPGASRLGSKSPDDGAEAALVSSAAGAAGALAGWAISSLGRKACDLLLVLRLL
jgi:hypothetical protein